MRPSARRNGTVRALTVVAGVSLALALAADRAVHASPAGAWTAFAPPQGGDGVGVYDPVRHRFIQFDAYHHAWALDLNAPDRPQPIATGGDFSQRVLCKYVCGCS